MAILEKRPGRKLELNWLRKEKAMVEEVIEILKRQRQDMYCAATAKLSPSALNIQLHTGTDISLT